MLGTLVALALARMPKLDTFIWDMPTGILRDCWLALSSLTRGDDSHVSRLEKVWVRFHNNREVIDTRGVLPPVSQSTQHSSGQSSNPSQANSNSAAGTKQTPDPLEWSYRHVEHPNFSVLPPLRSLTALNIDEVAYLEELSVLIEHSVHSLRELRIGLGSEVPRDGFSSTRDLKLHMDQGVPTAYQATLGWLMKNVGGSTTPLEFSNQPDGAAKSPVEDHYPVKDPTTTLNQPESPQDSTLDENNNATPGASLEVTQVDDPSRISDNLVINPDPAVETRPVGADIVGMSPGIIHDPTPDDSVPRRPNSIILDALTESLATNKALQQPSAQKDRDASKHAFQANGRLEEQRKNETWLKLGILELERIPLDCQVLLRTIDWSVVTTLTLLHCDSHESLWVAFRRAFTPQQTMSQPRLKRKSKMHLRNVSSLCPPEIPRTEYRMNLRRVHTNAVSSALIAFLKETLAPNSLESLFLQDSGLVTDGSGGRGPYDSNVSVEAICRGPLRRHRLSLKKVMIDSGDGRKRSQKWQKWKLDRDALSYVTSGKMSALREIAFSVDYKDWV